MEMKAMNVMLPAGTVQGQAAGWNGLETNVYHIGVKYQCGM